MHYFKPIKPSNLPTLGLWKMGVAQNTKAVVSLKWG